MRPPGDCDSIRWTKLVVGGLLGAFAGLVGWVAVTAPPPVERPVRFGKDADPEVFNRIAPRAPCAIVVRAGDEVPPALEALKRCLAERGVLP